MTKRIVGNDPFRPGHKTYHTVKRLAVSRGDICRRPSDPVHVGRVKAIVVEGRPLAVYASVYWFGLRCSEYMIPLAELEKAEEEWK